MRQCREPIGETGVCVLPQGHVGAHAAFVVSVPSAGEEVIQGNAGTLNSGPSYSGFRDDGGTTVPPAPERCISYLGGRRCARYAGHDGEHSLALNDDIASEGVAAPDVSTTACAHCGEDVPNTHWIAPQNDGDYLHVPQDDPRGFCGPPVANPPGVVKDAMSWRYSTKAGRMVRPRKDPESDWPTRNDTRWWTRAEEAIAEAMRQVEHVGASESLTKAVTLLGDAQAWLADHVEGVDPADHYPRPVVDSAGAELTEADLEAIRDLLRYLSSAPDFMPKGADPDPIGYSVYKSVWEKGRYTLTKLERLVAGADRG